MKRIKLVGFKTYQNKSGSTTLEIQFVSNIPMSCYDGFMCGGTSVGKDFMKYKPDIPLQVGSNYDLDYDVYEFQGRNLARLVNMILVK